jgi:hypothetical protein
MIRLGSYRHCSIKKGARHQGQIYLSLRIFLSRNDNSFESTTLRYHYLLTFAVRPFFARHPRLFM